MLLKKKMSKKRELLYDPDTQPEAWDTYNALCAEYDYDFESVRDRTELMYIEQHLQHIVHTWPDFFMGHVELWYFYSLFYDEECELAARDCLERALSMTDKIILDEKGNWPDVMDWLWLENRAVIRVLIAGARLKWERKMPALAKHTLRNVLKANPSDQPGVRFLILAINEKLTFKGYQRKFEKKDGTLKPSIHEWFSEKSKKYPEEFAEWERMRVKMAN